jgi:ABC-type transport system involved in cytochrome c biogenesis permease subunit
MHIVIFLFVMHTITLIARWYISGHAPWSNAYEALFMLRGQQCFGLALILNRN